MARKARCRGRIPLLGALVAVVPLLLPGQAAGQPWEITPRLTLGAEATDNIGYAPRGAERSDGIGIVRPGISVTADTPRLEGSLSYDWDSRLHIRSSDRDRSVHSLSASAEAELLRERAFLEGSADRQLYASSPFQPLSQADREERTVYRISPYLLTRYGRVADQELRYELRGVRYHRSEREPHHRHLGRYRLSSGAAWGRPFWVLSGSAVEHRYDEPGRGDFRRRDGDATLGYQLGESLRVSVTGGAGQYRVGDGPDRDTRRWSANTDWSPGRFGAGASWGESRLELADGEERTREQRSLALRYSSGRSEYRVSYTEEITDFGIDPELAELERFLNDLRELAGVDGVLDLDLDSRVAFTESWRAVWRYSVPEGSTWRLGVRQQEIDRDFVLAGTGEGQVDRERSVDGSWTRPLASRTDAGLNGSLGRRESLEGVGRERDYWRVGARIGHDISPRTRASLGYQHRQDRVEQPGGSAERFRENRLTALVRITF